LFGLWPTNLLSVKFAVHASMKKKIAKKNQDGLDRIIQGDCVEVMNSLPEKCVDVIFADPPYNLQLANKLIRPNETVVDAVNDHWDKFDSRDEYDTFTRRWLTACRRVLKDTGTIWVIGAYHNIFRVGSIMADLGFWTLNDIIWIKTNPMPNFRGVRFANAHETLIWAKKSKEQKKYTFNYQTMKTFNDDKQMRSDWYIPLCGGSERCRVNGEKAHSTQKPEGLLRRVILASTHKGDVILDPFFGSGTTGAVARKLGRRWLGIEKEARYIHVASERIQSVKCPELSDELFAAPSRKNMEKVTMGNLLESGLIRVGDLFFSATQKHKAVVCADGGLKVGDARGSIHKMGARLEGRQSCNGWDYWWYVTPSGHLHSIDELRSIYRRDFLDVKGLSQ